MTRFTRFLGLVLLAKFAAAAPRRAGAQELPPEAAAPTAARVAPRAAWLADRRTFTVGEILTVLVDEQAAGSERTGRTADVARSQRASAVLPPGGASATSVGFNTALEEASRQNGENSRRGMLSATISVRVAEVAEDGTLRIEGQREITVDGRRQVIAISGAVRPEDVSAQNVVFSSRVAEAVVSYSGKGASARHGIIGRILGMLWP
jgi:flagellar L-ring protein precursor FlgH